MRLSPLVFDRQFSRFKKQVQSNSGGAAFTSFQEGLPGVWEDYKEHVRYEAIQRLELSKWKRSDVGTGKILNRVIDAIEINEPRRNLRNNLVAWPNKWGHDQLPHRALLDATSDSRARREFEQWFFVFLRSDSIDETAFESFRELAGSRYDLIAYLFFLKDWTRFMPIAPRTFDKALALMNLDVVTSRHCSWENYQRYNDALRAVQRRLRDVGGVKEARLIDAHSFCWILVRLEMSAPPPVTIPLPEPLIGLRGTRSPPKSTVSQTVFDQVDEEWFVERETQQRRIGKLAQEIALQSERRRLEEAGHPDAGEAVKPMWNEPARGYDILSCEMDGTLRHIEVKATRRSGDNLSFFVTRNEFAKSRSLPNYYFYLVLAVESRKPKVCVLKNTDVSADCLTPLNYQAALTVTS